MNQLPKNLQTYIYEYNVEHRKKMRWVLDQIRGQTICEVCDKYIIKDAIYSLRGCDMVCCSMECCDNYGLLQYNL